MSLNMIKKLLAGLSLIACTSAFAGPLTINIDKIDSSSEYGDAGNTVLTYNVGANSTIASISYSVNLTAYEPSWLSELRMEFTDSTSTVGVSFTPAYSNDASGTASYSNSFDLIGANLDFQVGADGILRLEFHEFFDDAEAGPDGRWNFGSITFGIDLVEAPAPVPEPASALLMAGGLAALGHGRRRRAVRKADGTLH